MPIFRNTIGKSTRERLRHTDRVFERIAQTILITYALFVFSAWLSYHKEFQISEIKIEGARAVDPGAVRGVVESELDRHLLWKINRNNSLLYPKRAMERGIRAFDTRVKTVDIVVEKEKLLTVRLSEYSPAFLWCPPDGASATTTLTSGCYFADGVGHIFAPAPGYSGNPFLIFVTATFEGNKNPTLGDSSILRNEEFIKVNTFLDKLIQLGLFPRIVRQSGENDFTILTDQPWEIRWSSARDPEEDALNLSLVLQNLHGDHASVDTLKAIDLRFGNKVFYR